MDIVKRAYLKVKEEVPVTPELAEFHNNVVIEAMRLIRVRAYASSQWPREFGPLPTELRSKKRQEVKS